MLEGRYLLCKNQWYHFVEEGLQCFHDRAGAQEETVDRQVALEDLFKVLEDEGNEHHCVRKMVIAPNVP